MANQNFLYELMGLLCQVCDKNRNPSRYLLSLPTNYLVSFPSKKPTTYENRREILPVACAGETSRGWKPFGFSKTLIMRADHACFQILGGDLFP